MADIVLSTLNARYIHSALGLRYLQANLGELEPDTVLREFTIHDPPLEIVEKIRGESPRIVGFGVYIWNVEQTTRVVALLKRLCPELVVVLGGPEVSHEWEQQAAVELADFVITGPADLAFGDLCRRILGGNAPGAKVLPAPPPPLAEVALPYRLYTDEDLANRVIYVEASRGCPFKCEFCLSALDRTAWPFEPRRLLNELARLYDRGARSFKFVDRTFNLNAGDSARLLEFFLDRPSMDLFLHFELVPDHLPDRLRQAIQRFPAGTLQFEIGVQTLNPRVQSLIGRRQDDARAEDNLRWLRAETRAHLHVDLIAGLPGEDLDSFAAGFDRLVDIGPDEIQVGVLKRLRGAPIDRHTVPEGMVYNPYPPYNVISTRLVSFETMQRLARFARYWDLVANSGHFRHAQPALLQDEPFRRFMRLSDWLYTATGQTHRINLNRLYDLVFQGAVARLGADPAALRDLIARDFARSGLKGAPACLNRPRARAAPAPGHRDATPARQRRHLGRKRC